MSANFNALNIERHHNHHIVLPARIALVLSRHRSLSSIAPGGLQGFILYRPACARPSEVGLYPFSPSTCPISSAAVFVVSIFFLYLKFLKGSEKYCSTISKQNLIFSSTGNMLNFKSVYAFLCVCMWACVCVRVCFFITHSNVYPLVVRDSLLSYGCFYFLWCS